MIQQGFESELTVNRAFNAIVRRNVDDASGYLGVGVLVSAIPVLKDGQRTDLWSISRPPYGFSCVVPGDYLIPITSAENSIQLLKADGVETKQ